MLISNPISGGIARTWSLLGTLRFTPLYILPSVLTSAVLLLVLTLLVLLWPYGWVAVFAYFLWGLVDTAVEQIRQAQTYAEKVPFTIALGIYFLVWLPFGLICLPLLLVGFVGGFFAGSSIIDDRAKKKRMICQAYGVYVDGEKVKIEILSIAWREDSVLIVDFLHHNKTNRTTEVRVHSTGSFFVDDLGYQYDAFSVVTYSSQSDRRSIPPGVAIRYSVAYRAPDRPPGKISLVLEDGYGTRNFPGVDCNWQWEQEGSGRLTPSLQRTETA